MSITLKTRFRYNGQDYTSPDDLPPDVRAAYERALAEGGIKKNFVVNGEHFAADDPMPGNVRKLCDDVMSVIENNGAVTIPNNESRREPWLSKREATIVGVFAGGIVALVIARLIFG